jgi:uncharacterized protein (TIGR03000 family)
MYSMVLMMALTSGGDTPAIGHRGGGGCGGGCYGGCYGGGGGGRSRGHRGGGCCGCGGGGGYGGGCMGMGYGGGYGGCMGMGHGGCMGSGMGMGHGGCMGSGMGYGGGCMGSGMGFGGGCMGSGMGSGCYGGGIIMPGTGTQGTNPEQLKNKPKSKSKNETMAPAPATIVVDLPADAKLLIDNEPTSTTGTSRVFVSPTLNPGREYHYTLKAEIVKNGKSVKVEKVIAVRAGQITPASLTLPSAGVAQR